MNSHHHGYRVDTRAHDTGSAPQRVWTTSSDVTTDRREP